jgi:hypothetical protein
MINDHIYSYLVNMGIEGVVDVDEYEKDIGRNAPIETIFVTSVTENCQVYTASAKIFQKEHDAYLTIWRDEKELYEYHKGIEDSLSDRCVCSRPCLNEY